MVDEPGINDTPTTDEPGINDTPTTDQPGNNDTPTVDEPGTNDTPSTALEPFSWVSRTIAAIVVHYSSEDRFRHFIT
jgi:hypothetical protein